LILYSVVYRDVTRHAKGLYRLKHVGALRNGLAYLSRYNSGWFCHSRIKFGPEVTTLDVELARACPLNGDAGILSRTSAIEVYT
jgi:hypothetical protein